VRAWRRFWPLQWWRYPYFLRLLYKRNIGQHISKTYDSSKASVTRSHFRVLPLAVRFQSPALNGTNTKVSTRKHHSVRRKHMFQYMAARTYGSGMLIHNTTLSHVYPLAWWLSLPEPEARYFTSPTLWRMQLAQRINECSRERLGR
jgi:hypothetical protein